MGFLQRTLKLLICKSSLVYQLFGEGTDVLSLVFKFLCKNVKMAKRYQVSRTISVALVESLRKTFLTITAEGQLVVTFIID